MQVWSLQARDWKPSKCPSREEGKNGMGCAVVQQKPTQYCKAISSQLKINLKKKMVWKSTQWDPGQALKGMRQMCVYERGTAFNILISRKKRSKRLMACRSPFVYKSWIFSYMQRIVLNRPKNPVIVLWAVSF